MTNNSAKNSAATDLFAQIAATLHASRLDKLQEPPLSPPPANRLPLSPAKGGAPARPRAPRMQTAEQLREALDGLKKQMAPFLQDLAPAMPLLRAKQELNTFQWRIEQQADRADFAATLGGDGQWEQVTIPHYGPPLGIATTLYRKSFTPAPDVLQQERQVLRFDAVDYKCEVYLNNVCLGTHEGIFEAFAFDVTDILRKGENVLLVRVHNDYSMLGEAFQDNFVDGDKVYAATGLGYDDPKEGWHHCPAGMGIWQKVHLEGRARIAITDIFVRPLEGLESVEINIELTSNGSATPEPVSLGFEIYGQNFKTEALCNHRHHPGGQNVRGFGDLDHGTPDFEPALIGHSVNYIKATLPLPAAKIWELDTPWLYQLQVKVYDAEDTLIDTGSRQFGMRRFEQDVSEGDGLLGAFRLNGKRIRLRGANTMGNVDMCVFRGDTEQLHEDILLAKLTNMNFLRLTQHPVQREVYEACDRLGLMLQTDLPLFATIRHNQFLECVRQTEAMEKLVRSHPSSIVVSFINEPFPAARAKPHRFMGREDMEVFFEMCRRAVLRQNPDRVIKNVDGDYDPPSREGMPDNHCYCGWYIGHGVDLGYLHHGGWMPIKPDWYYGCGEFGSEALEAFATMQEFYPQQWLPKNEGDAWHPGVIPKAQSGPFHYLWYPTAHSAEEWIDASQRHQEWITRLMTESFRRKSGMNTFAIHLFIDAWPAGWMKTIMDVNRTPKRAWFTYRDALSPLAVFLRTDRTSGFAAEEIPVEVWLANDHDKDQPDLSIRYEISIAGKVLHSGEAPVTAERCAPSAVGLINARLPEVTQRQRLEIGVTLMQKDTTVHESVITIEVFPTAETTDKAILTLPGDTDAERLLEQASLPQANACDCERGNDEQTYLITDFDLYLNNKAKVDEAVRNGATVLMLNLPQGEHSLGNRSLSVETAGMGPRHFVSLAAEHPLVLGYQPQDFKFWFDESKGYVSPILTTVLEAPQWTPILNSGNGGWQNPWHSVPAAAEARDGDGLWRVCQVAIANRVSTNPVAHDFLLKMLGATTADEQAVSRSATQATPEIAARKR